MTRRRARLAHQLVELERALADLGELATSGLEEARIRSLERLRKFILPRLSEETLPLVVSLVGSTGSGKSTILNSIAGGPVSRVSVLRPTTAEPLIWSAPPHTSRLAGMGRVVADDHPLGAVIALVDTPDLDSDAIEHQTVALQVAEASDAVVIVTTAARYGDAAQWEALTGLPGRRMAVVLNRLPSRASGARQDLSRLLRHIFGEGVPVMTISEQTIDRIGHKLRPQAVQRLSAQLREWATEAGSIRVEAFESTASRMVIDLHLLLDHVRRQQSDFEALEAISRRRHHEEAEVLVAGLSGSDDKRRFWWRRAPKPATVAAATVLAGLDRAARQSFREAGVVGIGLGLARQLPPAEVVALVEARDELVGESIPQLFEQAARAWINGMASWNEEITALLEQGATILAETDYPGSVQLG